MTKSEVKALADVVRNTRPDFNADAITQWELMRDACADFCFGRLLEDRDYVEYKEFTRNRDKWLAYVNGERDEL